MATATNSKMSADGAGVRARPVGLPAYGGMTTDRMYAVLLVVVFLALVVIRRGFGGALGD